MVEITLSIVLQILQTAGILVGIIYYITIMRNTQRENRLSNIQLRMQTMDRSHYQAWSNVINIKYTTFEEWNEKYSPNANPEIYADWCYIGSFYNNVGYLLKHGMVDPDTVFRLYTPGSIIRVWRRYEVVVEERNRSTGSNLWQYIKYLRDEAQRLFPEVQLSDDA
jgi:hypothetical protein